MFVMERGEAKLPRPPIKWKERSVTISQAMIDETHAGLQKLYFVCVTRPARPLVELEQHLDSHKAYLSGLERDGMLLAAGPLLGEEARYDGNGLIVFRAKTREEAQQLADNDPFHARGLRRYELFPWQVNEGSFEVRLLFSAGKFEIGWEKRAASQRASPKWANVTSDLYAAGAVRPRNDYDRFSAPCHPRGDSAAKQRVVNM
jgi:uncharacterized protein